MPVFLVFTFYLIDKVGSQKFRQMSTVSSMCMAGLKACWLPSAIAVLDEGFNEKTK
ncbi:MAG: hypothetical protein ACP5DZ_03040 [Bacteroidales bacterium]